MRGLAAQNAADADDGVVASGFGQLFGGEGNLERSRDTHNIDLPCRGAGALERVERPRQQTLGDEAVEAADDRAEAQPFVFQLAADSF